MIGYPDAHDGADEEKFAVNLSDDVMITLPRWTWTCTIFVFFFSLSTRAHATQPLLRVDSRTMTHLLVSDSFLG
jgi:hypothetical protein